MITNLSPTSAFREKAMSRIGTCSAVLRMATSASGSPATKRASSKTPSETLRNRSAEQPPTACHAVDQAVPPPRVPAAQALPIVPTLVCGRFDADVAEEKDGGGATGSASKYPPVAIEESRFPRLSPSKRSSSENRSALIAFLEILEFILTERIVFDGDR
jgi:hypothetical protein